MAGDGHMSQQWPNEPAKWANTWELITKSSFGHSNPLCIGYVITLAHCPVIWASKMQTEIALSTMEAEYIALSTSCRDLFPLMDKLIELTSILDLPFVASPKMHVRIHEDNAGALILGQLEPWRMTPCSKHYAVISLVSGTYWTTQHWIGQNRYSVSTRRHFYQRSWSLEIHHCAKAADGMVTPTIIYFREGVWQRNEQVFISLSVCLSVCLSDL